MSEEFIFTPEICQQAGTLKGYGLSDQKVAAFFGISRATYARELTRDGLLTKTVEKAIAKAAGKVTQTCYEMATSGKHPVMTIFWCKTRLGWKEKVHVNVTSNGGIENLTIQQLEERLIELRTRHEGKLRLVSNP